LIDFPSQDDLTIHFAHPAYQLDTCLKARNTGIKCFQTRTPEDAKARIAEGHVVVASGHWNNDFLNTASQLRFVQVCAAGYNQFDLDAVRAADVRLANASGVNVNAVSDHAMALMLGLTRQIHHARDNQRAKHWRGMISDIARREDELAGKTVLIIGMGAIGSRLARLAKAFEMTVIGVRRNTAAIEAQVDEAHPPGALPELLGRADFVVLTCPLTDETANIIDAAALSAMQPTAQLINVARGGCVDQSALIDALKSGTIIGAGIDTTVQEPLDAASPLWDFDNIILTPHSAGETRRYEENVMDILLDNLNRLWRGETALHNQIV